MATETPTAPVATPAPAPAKPAGKNAFLEAVKREMGGTLPTAPQEPGQVASPEPGPAVPPAAPPATPSPAPTPEPPKPPSETAKPPDSGATPPGSTTASDAEELPPVIAKSPKASDEFKKQRDKYEKEISDLKTQLGQRTSSAEVEQLRKERDDLQTRLRSVSLDSDPAFNKPYQDAIQRNVGILHNVLEADVAKNIVGIILQPASRAKASALSEAMSELTDYEKGKIQAVDTAVEGILAERAEKVRTAQAEREVTERAAQADEEGAFISSMGNFLETSIGKALFTQPDGNRTQEFSDFENNARAIYAGELDSDSAARASVYAAGFPIAVKTILTLKKIVEGQAKEIEGYKGASLKPGGGAPPAPPEGGTKKPIGFVERIKAEVPHAFKDS